MTRVEKGDLSCLGKKFTVKVDRPIGAEHPKHPGLLYPINYGYVEGLLAGDDEYQDVYLPGFEGVQECCECVIVAVIVRENDNEDKWVGVPCDMVGSDICYECDIRKITDFQECYYKSEIFCLYEKTAGIVIFNGKGKDRKYFLIKNNSGHIGFPKGHVEYGESETETALRETIEECGLKAEIIPGFRMEYTFTTLENTIKTSVFFVGEFDINDPVLIQQEEVIGDWLINYENAMLTLKWENDKKILKAAEEFLNNM